MLTLFRSPAPKLLSANRLRRQAGQDFGDYFRQRDQKLHHQHRLQEKELHSDLRRRRRARGTAADDAESQRLHFRKRNQLARVQLEDHRQRLQQKCAAVGRAGGERSDRSGETAAGELHPEEEDQGHVGQEEQTTYGRIRQHE